MGVLTVTTQRFPFAFDSKYRVNLLFGVTESRAFVEVDDDPIAGRLRVRFGPWLVDTPLTNVVTSHVTGPYSVIKTIGPARLSAVDKGLTFATNNALGLCIHFRDPVRGLDSFGKVRHPGLTVTVDDVEALRAALPTEAD